MPQQIGWSEEDKLLYQLKEGKLTYFSARQIGWSPDANLLYLIKKSVEGKNANVAQQIGQGTETKELEDILKDLNS